MAIMAATIPLPTATPEGPSGPLAGKPGILDVPADQFRAWLAERRQPPMRLNQIRKQVLANRAVTFEEMTDLPKGLRTDLADSFAVFSTRVEKHLSAADGTHKLVLRLFDDRMIECVLIQDDGRATACISTQVGCGMGCVFCASGLNGVIRNLTVGEMVEQLVLLRNLTDPNTTNPERASRLTNIVVMGMGEPLANLDEVLAAIAVMSEPCALGIDARAITVCTAGLPVGIRRLAVEAPRVRLGLSVSSAIAAHRKRVMPIADRHDFEDVVEAVAFHARTTGLSPMWAVTLLDGVNDSAADAAALADRAHAFATATGVRPRISIVAYNAIGGDDPFSRSPREAEFRAVLAAAQLPSHRRYSGGSDVAAACGQLANRVLSG